MKNPLKISKIVSKIVTTKSKTRNHKQITHSSPSVNWFFLRLVNKYIKYNSSAFPLNRIPCAVFLPSHRREMWLH